MTNNKTELLRMMKPGDKPVIIHEDSPSGCATYSTLAWRYSAFFGKSEGKYIHTCIDYVNSIVTLVCTTYDEYIMGHLKGIVRAMVTKANNGKAERMNGAIQEIRTIGRGYATAKRFRTAILFFYGDLDLY